MLHAYRNLDAQDKAFEQLLGDALYEVRETDLTPEKRRARRAACDDAPLAFAATYFPRVFTSPWSALHRHIAALGPGRYTVSGFPMAGKSAFGYLGRLVHHIALGRGGITAIACRTQDKAEMRTSSLSRIIQANRLLVYDYDIEVVQDRTGHAIYKSGGGTTQLVAGSVNVGLRSIVDDDFKRIRLGIGDDLYDKETVRSDADNLRVTEWVTGELYRQLEPDALGIVFGNSIAEGAPIRQLAKLFPEQHYSFPILGADGEPSWPEHHSAADIEAIRAATPFDVWEGEYMDRPAERGDSFTPEWLAVTRVRPDDVLVTILVVDPAHGTSPDSCYKGACAISLLRDHRIAVTGLWIRREGYGALFDWLDEAQRRLPAVRAVLFENDFAQWGIAQPYYTAWCERTERVLPMVPFNSRESKTEYRAADKDSRILNLVHPHSTGLFVYADDVAVPGNPDWETYRRQYLAHGKSREKLDGLDAVASGYILVRRYVQTETFKPIGERRMKPPSWMRGSFR